jgi:hypothetical protein
MAGIVKDSMESLTIADDQGQSPTVHGINTTNSQIATLSPFVDTFATSLLD